jgi:hypothetical protein
MHSSQRSGVASQSTRHELVHSQFEDVEREPRSKVPNSQPSFKHVVSKNPSSAISGSPSQFRQKGKQTQANTSSTYHC